MISILVFLCLPSGFLDVATEFHRYELVAYNEAKKAEEGDNEQLRKDWKLNHPAWSKYD